MKSLASSHTTENMAMLLAGGGGGLRQGEHIAAPAGLDHPVNVQLTAMKAVGVDPGSMGEVTGTIERSLRPGAARPAGGHAPPDVL